VWPGASLVRPGLEDRMTHQGYRKRLWGKGPRRPRGRLAGCLLWILGVIIVLVILSLLFGGFQKGTKASGAGVPAPVAARAGG
jgi:hypothetical protein